MNSITIEKEKKQLIDDVIKLLETNPDMSAMCKRFFNFFLKRISAAFAATWPFGS